ncbi:ABC transporter substrate-binding protein [Pseudomonas auratipiscis]|uniref:ABC transporter substrate-binding protein n=1 Tax=Pseudomonas auratipiscis TaxID=3115853 RepID=A0AB35WY45_9PSED|nr:MULTISPECIES: ABC transporter substrate-binding protein [unclassified Pseudomonas]MEE1868349.1 ABC transporter substrate-binding protein [Pseudomonas sp. 120P]MEE1959833.1 ABC transporter substrate-binding protein [Pseudomonas sp. 119P]
MPDIFSRSRHLGPILVAWVFCLQPWQTVTAETAPVLRPQLVLAGPPASVSYPLIHMLESGALNDLAQRVEFVLWSNPDQLRAQVIGKQADFIAAPSNVAANLYNRGAAIQLLNVSTWGSLWMVSRNPGMRSLADFKGQEVALPFRADMPDILFSYLVEQQGLNPQKDMRLRYTATPLDALQLLVLRQVDHALLVEPAVSMALRKTRSFPLSVVAPELYRSVNLQQQWGALHGNQARIPQAGLAALGNVRLDAQLTQRVAQAYEQSNAWCFDHPQACAQMVARHIPLLSAEAVADSLRVLPRDYASAAQARPELEALFQILLQRQPASIGGKLPTVGFYASERE